MAAASTPVKDIEAIAEDVPEVKDAVDAVDAVDKVDPSLVEKVEAKVEAAIEDVEAAVEYRWRALTGFKAVVNHGQIVKFNAGDTIDPHVGKLLADTGAPVEKIA
jgi:hypothetical protein